MNITAVASYLGVLKCGAVAVGIAETPSGGGPSQLLVFAVPENSESPPDPAALRATMQAAISAQLNPLFRIARVELIESLPRTASNKIMRRQLRGQTRE